MPYMPYMAMEFNPYGYGYYAVSPNKQQPVLCATPMAPAPYSAGFPGKLKGFSYIKTPG